MVNPPSPNDPDDSDDPKTEARNARTPSRLALRLCAGVLLALTATVAIVLNRADLSENCSPQSAAAALLCFNAAAFVSALPAVAGMALRRGSAWCISAAGMLLTFAWFLLNEGFCPHTSYGDVELVLPAGCAALALALGLITKRWRYTLALLLVALLGGAVSAKSDAALRLLDALAEESRC